MQSCSYSYELSVVASVTQDELSGERFLLRHVRGYYSTNGSISNGSTRQLNYVSIPCRENVQVVQVDSAAHVAFHPVGRYNGIPLLVNKRPESLVISQFHNPWRSTSTPPILTLSWCDASARRQHLSSFYCLTESLDVVTDIHVLNPRCPARRKLDPRFRGRIQIESVWERSDEDISAQGRKVTKAFGTV
jgi:hypothetical protein